MEDQKIQNLVPSNKKKIPLEIEDTLFFLWFSGLSPSDIAKQYAGSDTPFSAKDVRLLVTKRGWSKRKQSIVDSLAKDFDDVIKHSKAKKMTAIAMAVDTMSEMIIKDVVDFRNDPKLFWDQVYTKQRPRPFWMAKSVDDLVNLFKLQQYLETGNENDSSAMKEFSGEQRSKLLGTLADLRRVAELKPELLKPEAVDAEVIVEEKPSGSDQT